MTIRSTLGALGVATLLVAGLAPAALAGGMHLNEVENKEAEMGAHRMMHRPMMTHRMHHRAMMHRRMMHRSM